MLGKDIIIKKIRTEATKIGFNGGRFDQTVQMLETALNKLLKKDYKGAKLFWGKVNDIMTSELDRLDK